MPCTIVRLAGCPLRCSYCDTTQALPFDAGEDIAIGEVVHDVAARARPLILVTGGEPLAQKNCLRLLPALTKTGAVVQLETSGAYSIGAVNAPVRRILDIKAPGSGEDKRNRWDNIAGLRDGDEIKIVMKHRRDYAWAMAMIETHSLRRPGVPILFSPVRGELEADDLARWMLEDNAPARLHLQFHKIIWGAESQGV